jgi:hypothetical protein
MGRRPTLLLLAAAMACFLLYLRSLVQSPLTTATSLETSAPASGSMPPLGLVLAVENPDLERTGDFTIRPTPIRCSLRGLRIPKDALLDSRGIIRLALADTNVVALVVTFGTDTSAAPQSALQLVFNFNSFLKSASEEALFTRPDADLEVTPIYLEQALDRGQSALEDADSVAFNVLRSFVTPIQRPFLYPFDSYMLELAASVSFDTPAERRGFPPSLSILCDRSGWTHQVSFPRDTSGRYALANVVFRRAPDVRVVAGLALVTLLLLILAIPFQRDSGSVLEVSFSFLLGLWGIKSVLVPSSVRYPTIVDSALVGLFALFAFSVLLRLVLSPVATGLRPRLRPVETALARSFVAVWHQGRSSARWLLVRFDKLVDRARGWLSRRGGHRNKRPRQGPRP